MKTADQPAPVTRPMRLVRQFHEKNGFLVGGALEPWDEMETNALRAAAKTLATLARAQGLLGKDGRRMTCFRAHLMLEELAETLEGLAICNPVKLLDGLADLIFVVIGCAVTFDLPLMEALEEVCQSNLTKERRAKDDYRLRDKGPSYRPPNIRGVLIQHWARSLESSSTLTVIVEKAKMGLVSDEDFARVRKQYEERER